MERIRKHALLVGRRHPLVKRLAARVTTLGCCKPEHDSSAVTDVTDDSEM